ncbi:hypothetical protein UFOVP63_39 [uncultured Caudovirales phage]|uniref:Uncharacterized protein n=1 Tax=uncultured Caudovirales phage TaxID=2100421 RepID=A0A6J5KXE5_9CAUD|nr:hypothetical protein UFOVP63_39 [uncultured Caudovirales phage]
MIAFLLTPIGRYVGIAIIVFISLTGIYYKIRNDAVAEMEAKANIEIIRRTNEAIIAGDRVDITVDRVRDRDKFQRD